MSIVLHIERLVIDEAALGGERGVDVRASLQRELTRWLAAPGAHEALANLGAVDGLPSLQLAPARQKSGPLAARIAAAVGAGLGIETSAGHPTAARAEPRLRMGNNERRAR
ncbi:MAG: hypothetical protein ABS82_16665 [Rhodanobacter sp. SCN 67-45]|nr:MAG: hypothetical protein ABS82_16665 [Rhodanobacter sp. SCN 67-45]